MKDIEGYEGRYAVTEDGRVWSYLSNKFLSPSISGGYLRVMLYKDNSSKGYYIHRLVAQAYLDNPLGLETVNHKDEDKSNNCVENLEWMTILDNLNYGTRHTRSCISKSRRVRCIELDRVFDSVNSAAKELGIAQPNITACCKGRLKTAGKYHWEYVEEDM